MPRPAPSRTDFHRLTVARVDPLTADAAAVTFDVPPRLAEKFTFAPGQSLTIRRGGERRSYSICAAKGRAQNRSTSRNFRKADLSVVISVVPLARVFVL